MTEQQPVTWLLSRAACAEVNKAMLDFTEVKYNTEEQNKDMTRARQDRDSRDTCKVLNYLQERSPFTPDASLRNISTSVNAHSTVNADNAGDVGNAILVSMVGKTVLSVHIQEEKSGCYT